MSALSAIHYHNYTVGNEVSGSFRVYGGDNQGADILASIWSTLCPTCWDCWMCFSRLRRPKDKRGWTCKTSVLLFWLHQPSRRKFLTESMVDLLSLFPVSSMWNDLHDPGAFARSRPFLISTNFADFQRVEKAATARQKLYIPHRWARS